MIVHYFAWAKDTGDVLIRGTIDEELWSHHQAQIPDYVMVRCDDLEQLRQFEEHGMHNFRVDPETGMVSLKPEAQRVSERVLSILPQHPDTMEKLVCEFEKLNQYMREEFPNVMVDAIRRAFEK